MTTYYFKVLMLGGDSDTIHFYASRAFQEGGEDQETYFKWYKKLKS